MRNVTRRQVLRTGTAGMVGALALSAQREVRAAETGNVPRIAPDDPIRTGFIGVGGRGTADLKAFLKQKGQQVVAICDINSDHLQAAGKIVADAQGKNPQLYSGGPDEFKRLLDRKDLHAVVTATPCFEHARIMLATIEAGKHIYGEKPLGLTVRECDSVVEAAATRPHQIVQVGFQWMANPRFIETIKRVHDGEIGVPIEGRFARYNTAPPLKGWFSHREKSGDWMLEQACHEFNVMNWVAGATPLRAFGMGRSDLFREGDPERNVTDYYAAIIEFPNNLIVHYAHGWLCPKDGSFKGMEQKVMGTKGAIEIGGDEVAFVDRKRKPEKIEVPGGDDTEKAFGAFLDSIREGKPSIAPVQNGRNASLLGLLVRKAVYERKIVTWDEMLKTC